MRLIILALIALQSTTWGSESDGEKYQSSLVGPPTYGGYGYGYVNGGGGILSLKLLKFN